MGEKNLPLEFQTSCLIFLNDFDFSYPTPYLTRDKFLNYIQPKLKAQGVYSRGRFGGWKYEVSK